MVLIRTPYQAHARAAACIFTGWLAASAGSAARADLVHRWSFDDPAGPAPAGTVLSDSVSSLPASIEGQGASFSGSGLVFPGNGTGEQAEATIPGYVNLPNGLISSKVDLSVEFWAAPLSSQNWQRIFAFGSMAGAGDGVGAVGEWTGSLTTAPGNIAVSDEFSLTFNIGDNINAQRLYGRLDYGSPTPYNIYYESAVPTVVGQTYHYVVTFEDGAGAFGSGGGLQSWYRDGVLVGTNDLPYHLSAITDVNNWIGRSQWTQDPLAHMELEEFRIYDHPLSASEIIFNRDAGPDAYSDPDSDDDGLLDVEFEDFYFGDGNGTATPAELALQDGSGDPDNDGYTNLDEQALGTDPTDDQSPPPPPTPDHLWTFTVEADSTADSGTEFTDEIGGVWKATLRGNGGQLDGQKVILPGNSTGNSSASVISAYLDLANGIVTNNGTGTSVTFEAWATPISSKNWQRLFDFGSCTTSHGGGAAGEIVDSSTPPGPTDPYDNLSLTLNNAGDFNTQQLEGEYQNGGPIFTTSSAATTAGQEYHYVFVVEDTGPGCHVSWYRDGVFQNADDFPFHLNQISDVNNWIGRSMYADNSNSNLALNELRIYRHALSSAEITASYNAGPDPSSGPPEPPVPAPVPVRLWDFNAPAGSAPNGYTFADSGSGEIATVHGNNALRTGTELLIGDNGGGGRQTTNGVQAANAISAYLELPNHFFSGFSDLSIEGWITPRSSGAWQRVWDFGNATVTHGTGALEGEIIDSGTAPPGFVSNDNIFLSMNVDGALGAHRVGGKIDGGGETFTDNDLSTITTAGTEYHFVMTVANGVGSGGPGGCQVKWYRNGVAYGSIDLAFRLEDMQDVNNWIGRSAYSGDQNSHLSINELRVYDRVISQQEINTSFAAGTDVSFPAPTANTDTSTLHEGKKVLIDVLANDTGGPDATTVTIGSPPAHGTVEVKPDGKILYSHDGSGSAPDAFTYTVSGLGGTSSPATVNITIATDLRINNPAWAMPGEPPATSWQLVDALPGLTFNQPLGITSIPGDTQQLFVLERMAKVKRIPDVTAALPTQNLFLDIQQVVAGRTPVETVANWTDANVANGDQNGLQGMAFHPDYASNGYFFVAYTVRINGGSYYQRISRFEVDPSDPATADPASEFVILQQLDAGFDHNGGDLHFGPDGYLYYAAGDGVNNDGNNDPYNNSQTITKDFFTGIFRIDVDKKPGNLEPNPHPAIPTDGGIARFSVPIDNPFVHTSLGGDWDGSFNGGTITALGTVRSEFWATGLRHVWRMSFDSATGDLWAGDVGQTRYEEVNRIVRGGNYGWVYREGAHDNPQKTTPAGFTSLDPFYEYIHNAYAGDANLKGNSVCGGYVYHGTRFPELEGKYVFSDSINGHVWQMDTTTAEVVRLTGVGGGWGAIAGQGIDPSNQDLLFCDYIPGKIKRLAKGADLSTGFPQTLTETGLFSDLSDLTPAPGMLPFEPNLRFWSDHADKTRWFGIPDGTSQVTWQQEGPWTFPTGMVWVKHFDLALTRGAPATNKRIETRVLVKTDDGVYGVSYRWNDAGTEAYLVEDAGVSFDLEIDDGGSPHTQTWQIPSRSSCLTCHGDRPLSFHTRQLNRVATMNGFTGNQIELLDGAGYLSNTPDPVATQPLHVRPDETQYPLEQRVRSYLAVNCGYCHQAGGSVSGFWDGRETLTLEQTGMIHGYPFQNGGDPANEYIVPGDPLHSIILQRAGATNGFTRMPPLATSEVDQQGIDLLTEWISSLPADRLFNDWASINAVLGGEAGDDDNDGRNNRDEFLLGSDPHSGSDAPPVVINNGNLEFERKPYRIYNILKSADLIHWDPWNVPENVSGYSETGMLESIPIPIDGPDPALFFRYEVSEP